MPKHFFLSTLLGFFLLLSGCFQFETIETAERGGETATTGETTQTTEGSEPVPEPNSVLIVKADGTEERFVPDFNPSRSTACNVPTEEGTLFLIWLRDSNTRYFLTITLDLPKAQEIEEATQGGNPVSEVFTSSSEDPITMVIGDANQGEMLYSSKAYPNATDPERGVLRFNHLGTDPLERTSGVIVRALLPHVDLDGFAMIDSVEFDVKQDPQICLKLAL